MNAAVHHVRAARLRSAADLVAPQAVQRMDADADDVAGADGIKIELFKRFIDDVRIAVLGRCGRREHIQPAGRNNGNSKGHVAWIDEMDAHQGLKGNRTLLENALTCQTLAMRFWTLSLLAAITTATLFGQQPAPGTAPDPAIKTLVGRLDLEKYKATIKGLTQFGDRRQGTERNRKAVDWIEAQLKSYGCPTERIEVRIQPAAAETGRWARRRRRGRSRRLRSSRAAKCDPDRAARAIAGSRGGPASTTIPTRSRM